MRSAPQGFPGCWVYSGSVRDRREWVLSIVFYKICTKIIHKLYTGLRFGLVCMECREPCHNRHTVPLSTNRIVISPKVIRTRNRDVQALYLSPVFSDFEIIEQCSDGLLMKTIFFEYGIGSAIELVKLLIFGIKYSHLKNTKATLLNDWWR